MSISQGRSRKSRSAPYVFAISTRPPPVVASREVRDEPADVEQRVQPAEAVDRLAEDDEIPRALGLDVVLHDVLGAELDVARDRPAARALDRALRDVDPEHVVGDAGQAGRERPRAAADLERPRVAPI